VGEKAFPDFLQSTFHITSGGIVMSASAKNRRQSCYINLALGSETYFPRTRLDFAE
jgi:hypothetical protein